MTQIFHMQPMIFNPLSVTSILNYAKFTNGDLLIISLKCKGYIRKILIFCVLINLNLIWKYHISHNTSKISKIIGITSRLRDFVTPNTLLIIYWPLIHPYLSYGFTMWGQAAQTYLNQILVLQTRALLLIYFALYWSHAIPLFVSSWSLPITFLQSF